MIRQPTEATSNGTPFTHTTLSRTAKTNAPLALPMRPAAKADGHDTQRLIDEAVPGVATLFEDITVGGEHPVREPVGAHELHTFSTGLSSGHFGGIGSKVMLSGISRARELCHPA